MERLVEPEPKDEHVSDGRIKQFLNSCEEWRRNPGQSAFAGVILKMPAFTEDPEILLWERFGTFPGTFERWSGGQAETPELTQQWVVRELEKLAIEADKKGRGASGQASVGVGAKSVAT
jgi:hypothetical protein